jgi:hypothetical protein
MALTVTDQVMFAAGLSIVTNGVAAPYLYGDVLPVATLAADLAARATLRSTGALRMVTVATTLADFATAAMTCATSAASQAGVLLPVLESPGAMPVVASLTG